MKTVPTPSPGAHFGYLTVIREARTPKGRMAVLCQCECGQQKIVQLGKLMSGHTKSCGCLRRPVVDLTKLNAGEVPLYGKKAAGRVVRVDEGDYGLVSQYRWHIHEPEPKPGRRQQGPYAVTLIWENGRGRTLFMHDLIMGAKGIDHVDHDGLNNRRSNLRVATGTQNAGNQRPQLSVTSRYKGVSRHSPTGKWQAGIQAAGRKYHLGYFSSEVEAARTYDAAAHELFGEFACPNFRDEPTQAARDAWKSAAVKAERSAHHPGLVGWWAEREPETRICAICGGKYQTRTTGRTLYCGDRCRGKAYYRRTKERELEGRLF